jgi:hypothetical protein
MSDRQKAGALAGTGGLAAVYQVSVMPALGLGNKLLTVLEVSYSIVTTNDTKRYRDAEEDWGGSYDPDHCGSSSPGLFGERADR